MVLWGLFGRFQSPEEKLKSEYRDLSRKFIKSILREEHIKYIDKGHPIILEKPIETEEYDCGHIQKVDIFVRINPYCELIFEQIYTPLQWWELEFGHSSGLDSQESCRLLNLHFEEIKEQLREVAKRIDLQIIEDARQQANYKIQEAERQKQKEKEQREKTENFEKCVWKLREKITS